MSARAMGPAWAGALAALTLLVGAGAVQGQEPLSVERGLEGLDGEVTFHYKGRKGIEGCGSGNVSFGGSRWIGHGRDHDPDRCGPGPVLVILDVKDGRVGDLDMEVGPDVDQEPGRDGDLGRVAAPEAAEFLLRLAETGPERVAEAAIFAAYAADSVSVWPRLIGIARDRDRPEDVRSAAVFWVGQEAAGVATEELSGLALDPDEDQEVRDAAVFALSQRPGEESVPILMELARTASEPRTRQSAMFWLAQSEDPQVLAFFERILTDGLGRR